MAVEASTDAGLPADRDGVLQIQMEQDVKRMDLTPAEAEALGRWIIERVKEKA